MQRSFGRLSRKEWGENIVLRLTSNRIMVTNLNDAVISFCLMAFTVKRDTHSLTSVSVNCLPK